MVGIVASRADDKNSLDAGQAPTLRGSAQLQATLEVPVYLDGREIARSTAHYMGEQMEFEVM